MVKNFVKWVEKSDSIKDFFPDVIAVLKKKAKKVAKGLTSRKSCCDRAPNSITLLTREDLRKLCNVS